MMDFKGTWRCKNGFQAYVKEFKDGFWRGTRDYTGFQSSGSQVMPVDYAWDADGRSDVSEDWDLMERISERWSKERSGGE